MESSYLLTSDSLTSKFGFQDGDVFVPVVAELSAKHQVSASAHDVLVEVVESYLLPLLPGVALRRVQTAHNPIRVGVVGGFVCQDEDAHIPYVEIEVSVEQIEAVLLAQCERGLLAPPISPQSPESVLVAGLQALKHRRVSFNLADEYELRGTVAAVLDDAFVVATSTGVSMIERARVLSIEVHDLTIEEYDLWTSLG